MGIGQRLQDSAVGVILGFGHLKGVVDAVAQPPSGVVYALVDLFRCAGQRLRHAVRAQLGTQGRAQGQWQGAAVCDAGDNPASRVIALLADHADELAGDRVLLHHEADMAIGVVQVERGVCVRVGVAGPADQAGQRGQRRRLRRLQDRGLARTHTDRVGVGQHFADSAGGVVARFGHIPLRVDAVAYLAFGVVRVVGHRVAGIGHDVRSYG